MRSASCPTPAQLDAYARKVANKPLTIQIFPSSVKVPQRKHIRRTVNGLDTSSSSQRHSPYPSQFLLSSRGGLLAVLPVPSKGLVKESDGGRARHSFRATMNPHGGSYAAQSTLNVPQLQGPLQGGRQKQGLVPPQPLEQSGTQPMALQHRSLAQAQALQRQQQQQGAAHPQALQRQQGPPGPPGPPVAEQQRLSLLQPLKHQTTPQQSSLMQQRGSQDLRHLSDGALHPSLQHSQGLGGSQALPQAVGAGPPAMPGGLQQPPAGPYGSRKLPDADAPPNVTVSTSTIPLSMAASLHHNRAGNLSSIVHQINQLCQARAGTGATSVCEGQIANPSPISRNLLINASSRVSTQHPPPGSLPNCLMVAPPDKAPALTPTAALYSQSGVAAPNTVTGFHTDAEKVQQLQQQQPKQQQLQQQRSWARHQIAHMQQPPEGAHPCKNPRMEPLDECTFPSRELSYPHKRPTSTQGFPLKQRPPSPGDCPGGPMPYMNGHYMQPPWNGLLATTGNNGSAPQDRAAGFQGERAAASTDRILRAKYRLGKAATAAPPRLMQNMEFMGGGFQMSGFPEQNVDVVEKMHRSAVRHIQEPGSTDSVHAPPPGYC